MHEIIEPMLDDSGDPRASLYLAAVGSFSMFSNALMGTSALLRPYSVP